MSYRKIPGSDLLVPFNEEVEYKLLSKIVEDMGVSIKQPINTHPEIWY